MALGLPIYLSLLFSGLYILKTINVASSDVIMSLYDGVYKYSLLAVPFFLFAGSLVDKTSFSNQLVQYVTRWTSRIRGGVALSGVVANEFFGAISGSSVAATGTIGKILFPVIRKNHGESFALGLLTSAGALAIIMPPSITMILFGSVVNVSIGKLFITGIIPALLIGVLIGAYIVWRAKSPSESTNDIKTNQRSPVSFRNFFTVMCIFFLPILILGGIYTGLFTPTESSAVAAIYVVLVTKFVLRELNAQRLYSALADSLRLTTQIFLVVAASSVFSQALTMGQIPQQLVKLCEGLSPYMFLLVVNIVLIFTGMFFDPASAVLVLAPIVAPIAEALHIDLLHLGIVFTVNIAVGMFTPPFGLNLFVSQAVFEKPLEQIVRTLYPFSAIYLSALLIITFLPGIYMWVPRVLLR
jgi:C4-dicarboxylate transporter DctM subunit